MISNRTGERNRGAMLLRQWTIFNLLKRHSRIGLTAKELSVLVRSRYRTIARDLEVMVHVLPIYYEQEPYPDGRGFIRRWKALEEKP